MNRKNEWFDFLEDLWDENKSNILGYLPYSIIGYFVFLLGNRFAYLFIQNQGLPGSEDLAQQFLNTTQQWFPSFLPTQQFIFPNFGLMPLAVGGLTLMLALYFATMQFRIRKNTREGE